MRKHRIPAYSLVELVVVLTILSIVSMMTLPNYDIWIKRFRYWSILQEIHPIKLQIEWCYWQHGDVSECNQSTLHIRTHYDSSVLIEQVDIEEGVIHVTPKQTKGLLSEDDVIMKPVIKGHRLVWHYQGQAVRKGYVRHG